MNNSDWYLNQLGITQYQLRKPTVMKGEASITVTDNTRLIIVSESPPNNKIFYDILKAINLSLDHCLILSPNQLLMPLEQLNHVIWFIAQPLPESWISSPLLSEKAIITTVELNQLATSTNLKRQLWNTLCQYENHFQSN